MTHVKRVSPTTTDEKEEVEDWFQLDRMICHTVNETMLPLQKHFHSQIIPCNSEFRWPPWLPNLSRCNFFLPGFLKSKVYVDGLKELAHIRTKIERVTRGITPGMCRQVTSNFKTRLENCVKNKCHHFKDVIFKTK